MTSPKRKKFNREIEALHALIRAEATPLPASGQKQRIERASRDMLFFGQTYFPHYFKQAPSRLHEYLCEKCRDIVLRAAETGVGDRRAEAAPRGYAKSTIITLLLPIWSTAYDLRKFILIISETANQAADFIMFIRIELETNERLKQDFPDICGEGAIWRGSDIITNSGVRVRGVGAGQKLRGMRHGSQRPDLVLVDDLENDESVVSPEQRAKLDRWFFRALMKMGKKYTVYMAIGTILHYDSLLANLLKKPGWKGGRWQAVLCWSKSALWEKWESLFRDTQRGREAAEIAADKFFEANQREMLAGTEVLWPDEESYYQLMKMRLAEGKSNFDSEKQNEPLNPDDCLFREEWIQYWEEGEAELENVPLYVAIDPSLGKRSQRHDPSAIIGGRMFKGVLYLEFAHIERRHPDQIINDVLAIHGKTAIQRCGVEAVQFQQFFADTLSKISHERGLTLNVLPIQQHSNKHLRIETLQPWIKNGWVRFKPNMHTLIDQLLKFPMADHDDGPDALEMLKNLCEQGAGVLVG